MNKFSKKGALLFAAAMALCAFAMPSTASAVSWDPLGTTQTITSPNLGFTSNPGVQVVSSCTSSTFDVDVVSATTLEVTNATFGGHCVLVFPSIAGALCTMDMSGTRFPWTITASSTTDIRLDNVHIDVTFTQTATGNCPASFVDQRLTITGGTTSGGSWDAATDELTLNDAEGLRSHGVLGPLTVRGTITDATAPRLDLTD